MYIQMYWKKKHVNRDSHTVFSPVLQIVFFEEVYCSILASSQRRLRGYVEFQNLDVTIKENTNKKILT